MLAAEARGDGTFFEGVVDCVAIAESVYDLDRNVREDIDVRWSEVLLEHDIHAAHHFGQEEVIAGLVGGTLALVEPLWLGQSEALCWWSHRCGISWTRGVELCCGAKKR